MHAVAQKLRTALFSSRRRTMWTAVAIAALVVAGIFVARSADAQSVGSEISGTVVLLIAYTAFGIAGLFGTALIEMVSVLVWVATYNGFVTSMPVVSGWVIMRDLVNMFFILALLLIAFGTILGVDKYSYRNKQLARLLIMAVVVNFSRTIAGVLIDFSQVVMLTFVNGFSNAAGGNFMNAFRMNELYTSAPNITTQLASDGQPVDVAFDIMLSMLLALLFTVIALGTVIIMTVVLLWRIVMLWLLIVMSPLAFFLGGVPGGFGQSYYEQWWKEFKGQVVVGPLLAFFLWLALVTVAAGNDQLLNDHVGPKTTGELIDAASARAFSKAFSSNSIGSFMVAIALMIGGVKMAMSMSAAVGKGVGLTQWMKNKGKQGIVGAAQLSRWAMLGSKSKDPMTGKERRRGGLWNAFGTAGGQAAFSKMQYGAGKVLGLGGFSDKKGEAQSLMKEASAAAARGDRDSETKLRDKATRLQGEHAARGKGRKALDFAINVGSLGMVPLGGAVLRNRAMTHQDRANTAVQERVDKAKEKLKVQSPQYISDVADRKIFGTDDEVAAAMLLGREQGNMDRKGKADGKDGEREFLRSRGYASQLPNYEASLRKHSGYYSENDQDVLAQDIIDERKKQELAAGVDPVKMAEVNAKTSEDIGKELRNKAIVDDVENGRVPLNESTTADDIKAIAPQIMQASTGAITKLVEKLNRDGKDGLFNFMMNAQREASPGVFSGKGGDKELQKMTGILMKISQRKDNPMGVAYGVSGGAFVGSKNAKGENVRTADEDREAYKANLRGKNGHDMLFKVPASELRDAAGKATDAMVTTLDAIAGNGTTIQHKASILEGMLKKVNSGEATSEEEETFQSVIDAIMSSKSATHAKLQQYVKNSKTGLAGYTRGGGAGPSAPTAGGSSGSREIDLGP